jgi:ubiquinone/menaquinone biosynthesis C-methylase UbiE
LVRTLVSGNAAYPTVDRDGCAVEMPFYCDFPAGQSILDIGCGSGLHMRVLAQRGCRVAGVDVDRAALSRLEAEGLDVKWGVAERLPYDDRCFDGIVCSVVLPLTDERRAVAEWGRVLVKGGRVRTSYHGVGYYLSRIVSELEWKVKFYAARTIANTVVYRTTGRRLPGFMGDTIYQSSARMRSYYRRYSLRLVSEYIHTNRLGLPEFIYHDVEKV